MATEMEMMPLSVGKTSRAWDEQHVDLRAAAGQIGGAPTGGFTSEVAAPASRFIRAWRDHTERAAALCEESADGLRLTIDDWIATDASSSLSILWLEKYAEEIR